MKTLQLISVLALSVLAVHADGAVPFAQPDARRGARLRDVKLKGVPGEKLDAFIRGRITGREAQRDVFGEARSAFVFRDDDERPVGGKTGVGGLWRGEFWGKLMLGTARVADYLQDRELDAFVRDECRRLIALEDPDGYLGSYSNKENVAIAEADKPAMQKAYGWNTVWNLWNRKYCIWAMVEAWRTTGDRAILESAERQMTQWIDMMHRLGLPLIRTGQPEKVGLPSMSVLKPLLSLYEITGKAKYLDYAKEIVADWDRDDGACPNFYRNAGREDPLHTWYPNPQGWGKCYEMMSCLDGLLEYYRVTGDRRSLETVKGVYDNLYRTERNFLGSAGYLDQFYGAAAQPNAATEVCDVIHWIRLAYDLYLITGQDHYLDAMETAYLNAFLAGVYRDGTWGAFAVRDVGRHANERQCGYSYNHCCVNNVPRTFMDMASATVTVDAKGVYHVNFYQDAEAAIDGVRFRISGNYPIGNRVTVDVEGADGKTVVFRRPAWCPKMDVSRESGTGCRYVLTFDMNPRLVERKLKTVPVDRKSWHFCRYLNGAMKPTDPVYATFRSEPAALVYWGPLLLAKSRHLGERQSALTDPFSVNGLGYALKLTPIPTDCTWGAWQVELSKPGEKTLECKACDYSSAADCIYGPGTCVFSTRF